MISMRSFLRHVRLVSGLLLLTGMTASSALAESPDSGRVTAGRTEQDDASLHRIVFVGGRFGWSVGDRGVILRSDDSGQNWAMVDSGVDCSLRDACFLTDRIGWVVGGSSSPFSGTTSGVVLFTDDGGESWRRLNQRRLPRIRRVQFFSLDEGIIIGEADHEFPTGILLTRDGGKTWQSVPGRPQVGWRAASFLDPDAGVVGGDRGRLHVVGDGALLTPQYSPQESRTFRDVTLNRDFSGWLVGDGGLVLTTQNGGVSWSNPAGDLPRELSGFCDFRTVASRGGSVWIAGAPGSVVHQSTDGGRTWKISLTGCPIPINSLHLIDANRAWACGELGMILRTEDAGESWFPVRGSDRRLAILAIAPRRNRVPLQMLAAESADLGYRSGIIIPPRESGPASLRKPDRLDQLNDAVVLAGGNHADLDWRFPVFLPDTQHRHDQLINQWQTVHERDVTQVFVGYLVSRLRIYRPSVVVIDRGFRNDASSQLIEQAVRQAINAARDPLRFPEQRELGGLQPWSVDRLFGRLSDGSRGRVVYDPDRFLVRTGRTVRMAIAEPGNLVDQDAYPVPEAYDLIWQAGTDSGHSLAGENLFEGIPISPGSSARRLLRPWDEDREARRDSLLRRQRNVRAIVERMGEDKRLAASMIAQLRSSIHGLEDDEAAWQLADLARQFRDRNQWSLVESTLVELVKRFPDQPISLQARLWLFHYWSSSESAWQRARQTAVGNSEITVQKEELQQRISRAVRQASTNPLDRGSVILSGGPGVEVSRNSGSLRPTSTNSDPGDSIGASTEGYASQMQREEVSRWLELAARTAADLRESHEGFQHDPQFLFAHAALLRKRGSFRASDEIYHRFLAEHPDSPWHGLAAGENWLLQPNGLPPNVLATASPASAGPPRLDGILGEPCWQDCRPLHLLQSGPSHRSPPNSADPRPLIYTAFDETYLYVAGSIPTFPESPTDGPSYAGRTHDARLSGFDRVRFDLDVDRDYSVWYHFEVDQRGWTQESCGQDVSWNPKYHVAVARQDKNWTFEMAIPFQELVPSTPGRSTVWAAGFSRLAPGRMIQSWNAPVTEQPNPEAFGLLRFGSPLTPANR